MKHTDHYLYDTWRGIRQRCLLPSTAAYKDYGARGISVFEEWAEAPRGRHAGRGFWAFASWVEQNLGERPDGHSLDRINNNGDYEPGNLRWADGLTQAGNKRPCSRHEDHENKYAYWHGQRQRWYGRFRHQGKYIHVGMFDTPEEASAAVRKRISELS